MTLRDKNHHNNDPSEQWHSHLGVRGAECPLESEKMSKTGKKRENQEKAGNEGKIGKTRKNRESSFIRPF